MRPQGATCRARWLTRPGAPPGRNVQSQVAHTPRCAPRAQLAEPGGSHAQVRPRHPAAGHEAKHEPGAAEQPGGEAGRRAAGQRAPRPHQPHLRRGAPRMRHCRRHSRGGIKQVVACGHRYVRQTPTVSTTCPPRLQTHVATSRRPACWLSLELVETSTRWHK